MEITIDIQRHQPLAGTASANGDRPRAFAGWLELLRVVAELAGTPTEASASARVPTSASRPGASVLP